MSRVFTVSFSFHHKTYTALVSFHSQASESSYLVRYLDEEVDTLIPGNKLLVSRSAWIQPTELANKLAYELVGKTTEAINAYLQLHEN